jgi:hypothetical protein
VYWSLSLYLALLRDSTLLAATSLLAPVMAAIVFLTVRERNAVPTDVEECALLGAARTTRVMNIREGVNLDALRSVGRIMSAVITDVAALAVIVNRKESAWARCGEPNVHCPASRRMIVGTEPFVFMACALTPSAHLTRIAGIPMSSTVTSTFVASPIFPATSSRIARTIPGVGVSSTVMKTEGIVLKEVIAGAIQTA